jgi:hypothetical protein
VDVEWEDLQLAFLSTRTDEEYYLDRETGEVVSFSEEDEDGEEEEAEEEEDEAEDEGAAADDGDAEEKLRLEFENDPDRFVEVTPVATADRVEWMTAFTATVKVKELVKELTRAANGDRPERDFDRLLRKIPAERGRWLGFLEAQVQEIIEGWIEENDIESETPPPWKPKAPRRRPKKAPEPE